jgi:anti-sigma factor RsiW
MKPEPERIAEAKDDVAAWRRAYRDGLPEGSPDCPSEEELVSLVVGEASADERARLADHLVACARCAATYRTLGDLHREASSAGRRAGRVTWTQRRLVVWAAAAVLLVAVGVALRVAPVRLPTGGPQGEVMRGRPLTAAPVEPEQGARLATPPRRLAWKAEDAGATYRVVLYDVESVPIWESDRTSEPALALPSTVQDRLARGGTFYWRVRVESERGPGVSPLYRFEVSR